MISKLDKIFVIIIGSLLSSGLIIALIGYWLKPPLYWFEVPPTNDVTIIGATLFISGMIFGLTLVFGKPNKKTSKKNLIRHGWTPNEKEQVRIRQDGKCAHCGNPPPRWHYHHVDGNRSNNSMNNCEGLCPNCHDVETHEG